MERNGMEGTRLGFYVDVSFELYLDMMKMILCLTVIIPIFTSMT